MNYCEIIFMNYNVVVQQKKAWLLSEGFEVLLDFMIMEHVDCLGFILIK